MLAEAGIGYDATLTYGVEPTARIGAEVAAQISATADQLDGVTAAEDVVLTPTLVVRGSTLRART